MRGIYTCFLWSNDEKLWQSVTGLLFRPDIFVSLIMARVLKTENIHTVCHRPRRVKVAFTFYITDIIHVTFLNK